MPPPLTSQKAVPVTPWHGHITSGSVALAVPAGEDFLCTYAVLCFNQGVGQVLELVDAGGASWLTIVQDSADHPVLGSVSVPLDLVFPGGTNYTLSIAPGGIYYAFTGSYLSPPGATLL